MDRFEWLGSFLSIDDEGGVHALLWPGRFKICDVSGSVLYNITVAEGRRCVCRGAGHREMMGFIGPNIGKWGEP